MVTIEINGNGSGILSILHAGATWERIPFANNDELEIIAYRNQIKLDGTANIWQDAYYRGSNG